MKRKSAVSIGIFICLLAIAQFFRPDIVTGKPVRALDGVPKDVNSILQRSCFDCHSSSTQLRWYDKITPANFLVASHIKAGQDVFTFNGWDTLPAPKQKAALYYALNKMLDKQMPLPSYTFVHPEAKITESDIAVLKRYLNQSASLAGMSAKPMVAAQNPSITGVKKPVAPSVNSITYYPDYRNWKVISTTNRFDNGTLRIIYANDVAYKAISAKSVNPWPNGAVLAKAAWKQQVLQDGSISTGAFVQVEFMIKDSKQYEATNGWGWARWKGDNLKPYGNTKGFEKECISCHRPVANQDYVFTKPIYLKSY